MNHTFRYTLIGIILGFGAPAGAILIHPWLHVEVSVRSLSDEYDQFSFFYNYMMTGTVTVFGLFGFFLGRSIDKLHELSVRDGLTGIYNRLYFQERLEEELHRAIRYHAELTLIMFDLDFFKSVNDRFGHAVGDTVLKRIALVAQSRIRESDILARYGGEEFVILLPEISQQNAFLFAESLRQEIEKNEFKAGGIMFKITISLGLCSVIENRAQLPNPENEEFTTAADRAMYAAKKAGRNQTVIYSSSFT